MDFFAKHTLFLAVLRRWRKRIVSSQLRIPLILWVLALTLVVVAFRSAPQEPLFNFPDSSEQIGKRAASPQDSSFFDGSPQVVKPVGLVQDTTDTSQVEKMVGTYRDTTVVGDTTRPEAVDSSARVEHFVHRRTDPVHANGFALWTSPFYLNTPSQYRREISLDSTGRIVTVRETVLNKDVKIPVTMSLEEYIEEHLKHEQQRQWQDIASDYRLTEISEGLESVLGQFTNIDIPVPANPVLSIFGPPRINLRISGAVDIRAAFRNQKSDQQTIALRDQVRNEPDFNQDVQVNVNGTIGDKLNILADWNTQRVFEYENQLKIKYTGYEDEIVQSIEAGNVSFGNLPPLVGSSQALFGIKAKFQAGPLFLTTLISQKKGQTKEITVSGGAQTQIRQLRAPEYSRNHFFLDTLYRKFYNQLKQNITPILTPEIQRNRVKDIEVWVSIASGQQQNQARNAVAHLELGSLDSVSQRYPDSLRSHGVVPGKVDAHQFIKLKPSEYVLHENEGYITINTNLNETQIVAASYRIENIPSTSNNDLFFGEFEGSDTSRIVLKLIRPSNLQLSYRRAWNMMLKNIYYVGGSGLRKENFEVKVLRDQAPGEPTEEILGQSARLLSILGLNRFGPNNEPEPDNLFDFIPGLTIDPSRGEIIFPSLEPFRTNIQAFIDSLLSPPPDTGDYIFHEVYDTTVFAAQNNTTKNKYIIDVKFQAAQTSRFNLGFNLVEGSVKVLLHGNTLTPNVDYTIDYITGEVVIRNQAALIPGADLQIKYEQNDLFQLAAKTLIGARGEMSPFANTNFGFTVMNLNKQTLSDKVRLGEEPTNNTIFGIDGSTSFNIAPLTDALNALPLYQTREMSSMRVSGEAAYMVPDPNTKKSPITSDRGEAIAYIDDFEGARRTIPLGLSFSTWAPSGPPVIGFNGSQEITMSTESKAKLSWYNPDRDRPVVSEIWPNRSVRRGDELVTVLDLDFYPSQRGTYNYSPNIDSTLHREGTPYDDPVERRKNWNGVMKYLSTTGSNLLDQNIGFLEIWMKVEGEINDIQRGRLYVNLGAISEAVITSPVDSMIRRYYQDNKGRVLATEHPLSEDLVVYETPNSSLNEGEDLGIDMLTDAEEQQVFPWLSSEADPSGDDYSFATGSIDFSKINGLENNKQSPAGLFPNTEDLNNNFLRDELNSYLEYEIPLDSLFTQPNPYIVGGGINRWYQFRIPLTIPKRIVSQSPRSPQDILQNLQYVRLYVSGFAQNAFVRIADISLVGNQWQEFTRNDFVLRVSVVNIEDNPQYTSPPGVIRERDRTQPDQQVFANEQSLALILTNLPVDSMRQAVKNFPAVRPLDVFNYRSMKMFVHGDQNIEFIDTSDYDASIFLRFGSDTAHFYEYRQPIRPGWENNDMEISFSALTAIKTLREARGDSIHLLSPPVPVEGRRGAEYRIRGNPTLTNIRAMWVGIINVSRKRKRPLSGEVWINELRLIGVDDEPGFAYRFDTQLQLADLGNVTFNYSKIDPRFHGLEDRFGSRVTNTSWGLGVNLGLEKFFPKEWEGTAVPFNYSHTENLVVPKYLPNTDVEVSAAASRAATPEAAENIRISSQSFRVTETYAVPNFRIGLPSKAWYIRDTFNKLSWAFTYTTSRERSPVIENRTTWQWNGRVGYALTLSPEYYLQPFSTIFDGVWLLNEFKGVKMYYTPTNISAGLGVNRSKARERARAVLGDRPVGRSFTASRSVGFGYKLTEGGFTNISGDYGLSIESNLTHLETDALGNQRPFSFILADVFFNDRFINFGKDGRYGQRFSANSRPKIPPILSIDKYLDLTLGYSVNYSWQNNFQRGDLDKSSGWDNSISMSTNLRLKALTDPWFSTSEQAAAPPRPPPGRRSGTEVLAPQDTTARDTTKVEEPEQETGGTQKFTMENIKRIFHYFIKIPLLDYETVNISYVQTNRAGNGGVVGGPGFLNFWGRVPFFQEQVLEHGPTRLYQLGLISDPSGKLHIGSSSRFPFVRFDVDRGLRAANAQLADQYGQTHRLTMRTNRALWEGAQLDLSWNVGWTFTKNTTVLTDSLGVPAQGSVITQGSVERSFFTLPPVLFFKAFKSGLEDVGKKYSTARRDLSDRRPDDAKLAEAFETGFETLPFFTKIFGQYFPRVNYTFRWDGLERLPLFSQYTERLSLEHGYTSSFIRQWRGDPDGGQRTDAERISYGFAPLLGLNASMKELLKGNVVANIRYNTTSSYDLNVSARNIVETFSREIAFTFKYSRRGFEFLLFGISLSNDLETEMTYSLTKSSRRTFDVNTLETNAEGTPLEGSTRTVIEPRIRYVLSSRVTASIFYRYTKIAPDEGGSFIIGSTVNEAGLDIHIAIQ